MRIRLLPLYSLLLACAAVSAPRRPSPEPLCAAGPESAFQDDLLDRLAGKWTLTGNMMGRELLQECSGEWVLHHKFLRLDCRETKDPPLLGVRYESIMYIGCSSVTQRYVVNLVDVFGAGDTLGIGHRTGNSIVFTWDSSEGAFENTFVWNAESSSWTSSLRQRDGSGAWKVWGEKVLRRSR